MADMEMETTKVLLLKNYPSASASDKLMLESFSQHIRSSVPHAHLDICCIANGEEIPDLSGYELVILSGGKVNLLEEDKQPPWVLQVLDMVRKIAADRAGPRLLGICWGHQAVHYALGGSIAWLEDRPRIGVQEIQLTPAGQRMFESQSLKLHKYHVRYVSRLADGLKPLAQDNEVALSKSGRILTFQGHPEMTGEISEMLSAGDDGTYKVLQKKDTGLYDITTPHDGARAWTSIMDWVMAASRG